MKKYVQSSSYSTSNMHDCIAEEIVHAKVNFDITQKKLHVHSSKYLIKKKIVFSATIPFTISKLNTWRNEAEEHLHCVSLFC